MNVNVLEFDLIFHRVAKIAMPIQRALDISEILLERLMNKKN